MRIWSRVVVATMLAVMPAVAAADQWNEKTELTFSEPVMIPGATLQPGTYVFKLADLTGSRHTVQVFTKNQEKLITTTHAVPTKRLESSGDVVLKFNPTDTGAPPALKAWFYPGSTNGHQFVYPPDQARQIAQRTKTIVLSMDTEGDADGKGTLHTFDASGNRAAWQGDAATMREWDEWRQKQSAGTQSGQAQSGQTQSGQAQSGQAQSRPAGTATVHAERRESSAPMIEGHFQGTRVRIDDLEDNPTKYIGQTISVDAKVEEVLGPRLFTIDEPAWGDLAGEVLVFMKSHLAALVKEDDRVTITGKVQPFARAEVEREWGWFGLDPEVEVEFGHKPILVAEQIVGGNDGLAMVIEAGNAAERPVGTAGGGGAAAPITDAAAARDIDNVGRRVDLKQLQVSGMAVDRGFFVRSGDRHLFVLPGSPNHSRVQDGQVIAVSGVLLRMPDDMAERLKGPGSLNEQVYVYATKIGS